MKKLILNLALFIVIIGFVDIICGECFKYLRKQANSGQTYKVEYISNVSEDDIIILGSSRASHHYIPSIIEDSLGLTCINAGELGCGIIPAYVRYKMIRERHKPRLVLYEVTPEYDYLIDNDYSSYLGSLRQYTNKECVKKVYLDFSDNLESLRVISNMYQNNSRIIMNLKDLKSTSQKNKGYEPLYEVINTESQNNNQSTGHENKDLDSLKVEYLHKLIEDTRCDSVPLVFVISPLFGRCNLPSEYKFIEQLCNELKLPLINNFNCSAISDKKEYFQDLEHLNNNGAIFYSEIVSSQLKSFF